MTVSKLTLVIAGVAIVLVLLAVSFNTYLAFQANSNAHAAITANHDTIQRVKTVQHVLSVSQKASTHTRVSTVTQRCDLTRLILRVLARVHDAPDAAPFRVSYATCIAQLKQVKLIDARTPSS